MDNKKGIMLVSLLVVVFVILLISIFSNLKKDNAQSSNANKTTDSSSVVKDSTKISNPNVPADAPVNVSFCKTDNECLKKIFLACERGSGYIKDSDDKLSYAMVMNNLSNDMCNFSFMGLDEINSKYSAFCSVPKNLINEDYFSKLFSKKYRLSDKNCVVN